MRRSQGQSLNLKSRRSPLEIRNRSLVRRMSQRVRRNRSQHRKRPGLEGARIIRNRSPNARPGIRRSSRNLRVKIKSNLRPKARGRSERQLKSRQTRIRASPRLRRNRPISTRISLRTKK